MLERRELVITRVGAQGDGIAEVDGAPVYVPYTLAGERVGAEIHGERGKLIDVIEASAHRVAPPCRHFGSCGGCALQHMDAALYLAWKRQLVADAFAARGLDAAVSPTVPCAGKRRRATFAALPVKSGVVMGFHRAQSHDIVDLSECIVLHPAIVSAMPRLRTLVAPLLARKGETRVTVTWTNSGLDIAVEGHGQRLTPELRADVARNAAQGSIARVSVGGDPVVENVAPVIAFGRAEVVPPPGGFLQAVGEAEAELAERIAGAAGKAKSVADLFCGIGAFSFRLATRARVFAADADKAGLEALAAAARKATGLKPIETCLRDLYRQPLSANELNTYEAVVFDPPRAGAEAQSRMIARAKVKTVVAVSCNPATLARDARVLVDGGYKIESVTPVDQFLYTAHVEAIAIFRR